VDISKVTQKNRNVPLKNLGNVLEWYFF
jgi:hypothetical protein